MTIVTRLGAGGSGFGILDGARDLYIFQKMSRLTVGPPSLLFSVPRALCLGIKWLEYEADHSPKCSAEVKK